jgi:DNA-binding response OmpR family regulator
MLETLRGRSAGDPVHCRAMPRQSGSALVVEDDEQIAHILRFILEREGFKVHAAPDGRTAQELIASLAPPAIVILDVMLPRRRLERRAAAGQQLAAVPVIR